MVKFLHVRRKGRHCFEPEVLPHGGITFAYEYYPHENKLAFAYAKCSKKDLFNRQIGRDLAQDRLETDDMWSVICQLPPNVNVRQLLANLAESL